MLSEVEIEFHKWFIEVFKRTPDMGTGDLLMRTAFIAAWEIRSEKARASEEAARFGG